ncbi:hypothetical protein AVEN_68733-1 [Araneus ventricosus]|uniref:Uncharacterized protein n=1 Tax=Araneus ventricosus TaxID=182803 RepID=A0A4Y2WCA7_ARAVE|nr:hypothetical protein AVEN_68733-1 [Araneus ventricosus]
MCPSAVVRKPWIATPKGGGEKILWVAKFKRNLFDNKKYKAFLASRCGCDPQSRDHEPSTPPGVATMVITPPEGRDHGYHSQEVRDHGYHTSRRGRDQFITSRGCDHGYHTSRGVATILCLPPDGSHYGCLPPGVATIVITPLQGRDLVITPQRGRDHGYNTSRGVATIITSRGRDHGYASRRVTATMIITPPGSRPWLSHLQKGSRPWFFYLRGVATMIITPPEGSRP